jgi:hypothetical protein
MHTKSSKQKSDKSANKSRLLSSTKMRVGAHTYIHSFSFLCCMILVFSREFLTGFHKRKLAKKEEGKKKAQAREKQERLEARREVRMFLLSAFASQNQISLLIDTAKAYARRAGRPERSQSRRGIRWLRAECVLQSISYFSIPSSGSSYGAGLRARVTKNSDRFRRGMERHPVAIQSGWRWSATRGGVL